MQYRKDILGIDSEAPIISDKIICLKNNWDIISDYGDALINGMIGMVTNVRVCESVFFRNSCYIDFSPEDYDNPDFGFYNISIDYKLITEGEESVTKENFGSIPRTMRPEKFDYGYAITCHKSQGSEYNKVLLLEEILRRDMHARWLYTGITRAKEKLTLVLNR